LKAEEQLNSMFAPSLPVSKLTGPTYTSMRSIVSGVIARLNS